MFPLSVWYLIGVQTNDPASYGALAYAVDHRLLTKVEVRQAALAHFGLTEVIVRTLSGTRKAYAVPFDMQEEDLMKHVRRTMPEFEAVSANQFTLLYNGAYLGFSNLFERQVPYGAALLACSKKMQYRD